MHTLSHETGIFFACTHSHMRLEYSSHAHTLTWELIIYQIATFLGSLAQGRAWNRFSSLSDHIRWCTHRLSDWLAPSIKLLPWIWLVVESTYLHYQCVNIVFWTKVLLPVSVLIPFLFSHNRVQLVGRTAQKRKFEQRGCMLALDKWRLASNLGTGHIVHTVQLHSSVQSCCVQLAPWLPRQHICCSSLLCCLSNRSYSPPEVDLHSGANLTPNFDGHHHGNRVFSLQYQPHYRFRSK